MHDRSVTDRLNFLLTNRIPRTTLTRCMGWFSRIEQPLVARASIAAWRVFADLRLDEARTTRFLSLRDCFVRELKAGARPIDIDRSRMTSPCDAIVGACGRVEGTRVFQAKGCPYTLHDLLADDALVETFRDGVYATLRITSSMYHRFHAPYDLTVSEVRYFSGDIWNINPPALARIEKLFCQNERAILRCSLAGSDHPILLVPIAAVLVASIRLHCIDVLLHLRYRGPHRIPCEARFAKGREMGWFEHGSTILVFAPRGFGLHEGVAPGKTIRVGEGLLRLP